MIADIVVIATVFLFVWRGYKKGLMKTLLGLVSYVLSLIVAFLIYPVVSEALMNTAVYDSIVRSVNESGIFTYVAPIGNALNTAEAAAQLIIRIIAFIAVLIISRLLIKLVVEVLGVVTRLPVIKQFNGLGGAVFGGVIGIIVTYIAAAVLIIFAPSLNGGKVVEEINSSTFAKEIYRNNVIVDIIRQKIEV